MASTRSNLETPVRDRVSNLCHNAVRMRTSVCNTVRVCGKYRTSSVPARAPRQPLCRRPKRAGSLPSGCLRRDGLGGGTSTQGGRRDASRRRGRLRPRRPPLLRRGARPTSSSSVSASRQRRSREASSGVLTLLLGRRVPCQPRAGVASGVTVGLASRRPKSAPRAPSSRIHLAACGALVRSLSRRALSLSQHSSDSTCRARQADTPRGREDGGKRLTDPALPPAIGDEIGCAGVRRRQSSREQPEAGLTPLMWR